jgi:DNA-binding XRE family transcriptional regulator
MRCNETYPAQRDWQAADLLQELREDAGLSREALAHEIAKRAGKNGLYPISAKTIYRIEVQGGVPTARVKFALAEFFGRVPSGIWERPTSRRRRLAA